MSHNYGLISSVDAAAIEKTLDLIMQEFPGQQIKVLELGLYSGNTGNGIRQYIESKSREVFLMGIDSGIDGQKLLYPEAYDQIIDLPTEFAAHLIADNSFHLCFVDALHTYTGVLTDFFLYKEKVKSGGFIAFHDTAPQAQGKDWQRTGDKDDPNQYIQVRKALSDIGLLKEGGRTLRIDMNTIPKETLTNDEMFKLYQQTGYQVAFANKETMPWCVVFDEHDKEDEAGGIIVLKRIA